MLYLNKSKLIMKRYKSSLNNLLTIQSDVTIKIICNSYIIYKNCIVPRRFHLVGEARRGCWSSQPGKILHVLVW